MNTSQGYSIEDCQHVFEMIMRNTVGYETMTREQLQHVVKTTRHFVNPQPDHEVRKP